MHRDYAVYLNLQSSFTETPILNPLASPTRMLAQQRCTNECMPAVAGILHVPAVRHCKSLGTSRSGKASQGADSGLLQMVIANCWGTNITCLIIAL